VRQGRIQGVDDAAQALDRAGVATIISSFTLSNTTMMVGRTNIPSGTSSASGGWSGSRSMRRTVSWPR
jgi:dihydroorotate dehydrogenase